MKRIAFRRTAASLTVLIGTTMALYAGPAAAADSDVIARVGSTDLTIADVRAYIDALDPRQQAAIKGDPTLLSEAVRNILIRQVVLKEALTKKWDQQPVVTNQLARLRDEVVFETYLASVSAPPDGYPSDADIQAAYEANKSAFLVPRQFQLAQIFVAVTKDADKAAQDAAKKRVDDIVRKLRRGADFDTVLQTDSDDKDSVKNHGVIGWLTEAQITPDIRPQVTGLAKNDITDPLRLDDGWHILKLLDTQAAHTRTLAEAHDQIVAQLRAERIQSNRRAYLAKLAHDNPSVINELALPNVFGKSEK